MGGVVARIDDQKGVGALGGERASTIRCPEVLWDDPLAADRFRGSGRQHPVQDRNADGSLGLLGSEAACGQPGSDQRFVTAHCRFDQRALTVAGSRLPSQPSAVGNYLQVAITLCGRTRFATRHGCCARRNHHLNTLAERRNGLVSGRAIIRTIGRHPDVSDRSAACRTDGRNPQGLHLLESPPVGPN
jgi:hypothetical protein